MPVKREILQQTLEKAFPSAEISLKSLTGDDDHWEANIKSADFAGKTRINQHRMVTDAVNHLNIHALSIKTSVKE